MALALDRVALVLDRVALAPARVALALDRVALALDRVALAPAPDPRVAVGRAARAVRAGEAFVERAAACRVFALRWVRG